MDVKYIPHPIIIGLLAALMMVIEPWFGGWFISWIAFQAWAVYFLAGMTIKGGAKSAAAYAAGSIAAAIIIMAAGAFGPTLGAATLPVIVGVVATLVIFFEKVPGLDFIPAWFIGAGAHFALANGALANFTHQTAFIIIVISSIMGLIWGFFTVSLRGKYQAWVDSQAKSEKLSATAAR